MEPLKWADLISLSNVIIATTAAIIALMSPMIAWRLTRKSQIEDQKRNVKINILGALMENRPSAQTREVVRALNLIDVAYHDSPAIRTLWREYHGMITNSKFFKSEVGFELIRQKMEELQAAMAKELGFGIDRFDVERVYSPTWLVEEDNLRMAERQARLGALTAANVKSPIRNEDYVDSNDILKSTYLVQYEGSIPGGGFAFLMIDGGRIVGSDMVGVKYDGHYKILDDRLLGSVSLTVPVGVTLITGQQVNEETNLLIDLNLPLDFADGTKHKISVLENQILVSFKKISI